MKPFVVYTAMIGGYDEIRQPLCVDDRFDYVLFTDEVTQPQIGVWQVRMVEYTNLDKTRIARYVKTHPHDLLRDYIGSVWIDANIVISSQYIYDRCVDLCHCNTIIASVKHPYRDCIYDEAYMVLSCGLETESIVMDWCHFLREQGYPLHNGLFETNILYRNNVASKKINEEWWSIICDYSRRDQLSLQYVLWKNKITYKYILPESQSAIDSENVIVVKHKNIAKQGGRRGVKQSFLEHARSRCRVGMTEKENQFREFHYWLYGLNPKTAKFMLALWGIYSLVVYGAIIKYRAYKKHQQNG